MPSVRSSNVLVGHPLFTMGSKHFWSQTQNLLIWFKLVQTCWKLDQTYPDMPTVPSSNVLLVIPTQMGSKTCQFVESCIKKSSILSEIV